MLQVDEELKRLYQTDSTDKNLIVEFRRLGQPEPFLRLWESGYIMSESMTIEESLSSSEISILEAVKLRRSALH